MKAARCFSPNVKVGVCFSSGKMELFSKRFERKVKSLFMEDGIEGITLVATVPVAKIPLVESLKSRPDCQVFVVTRDNRDHILDEILPLANSK